ncbi:urea carboxylase [Venturia nashicola]|uniref:Urea carboxylase n=1 Tax=Venturia nashicola TaxID=86259 RepID=A0A4Z1PEE7_9PEZI|nr:urea carboxylase [Venturia nashicola]
MEKIKTLLIANRGEITVRIIKTAKKLGIKTISIYTEPDAASKHVSDADEAYLLSGTPSTAYTDGDQIIKLAKEKGVDAIIPGYGFLSENADFARQVAAAGIVWVGPSPESIEEFGVKHVARELAEKAGVPIVPGTKGLVKDEEDAARAAENLGFPVMLKATGGGGGMGLITANNADQVREGFQRVTSRGAALFKNPGVFIERYYPASRHIEVQVFGNGQGKAIHLGERECSIQRRHQKVIEECPSPFVEHHLALRQQLGSAAVSLAESIKYGSAGTVEFLVDDKTGDYFFLEMNTRLQVEHGITELCYNVDLVELMLHQADLQLAGKKGLKDEELASLQPSGPKGCAIEVRVYAENPLRDYAPSPGLLQKVEWPSHPSARIDTWVFTGARISPNYDPLIAKVMFHNETRLGAIEGMTRLLTESRICGPPTNLAFLAEIMSDPEFQKGNTLTSFLAHFKICPQDLQWAVAFHTLARSVAFQIANMLVGNSKEQEGLEITLSGPELRFLSSAVIALTGATMDATIDGKPMPMWTRIHVEAGQKVKIGKTTAAGCRSYLAIYGGFPDIADYFGSKSTSPLVAIGGNQGRALAPGDLLTITTDLYKPADKEISLPEELRPPYSKHWEIAAMVGPHDEGFLTNEDINMLYDTHWKISHNASRSGIRLVGPKPKWARKDGGEGGAHPSNLIEYGYPIGGLNWTGDDPCIFPVDCPNFGGFICSTTVVRADWWKLGQIKAGDTMQYKRIDLEQALEMRQSVERYLLQVEEAIIHREGDYGGTTLFRTSDRLRNQYHPEQKAVLWQRAAQGNQPMVMYRQGGDDHVLVEYGEESFDLNHRCRVTALEKLLTSEQAPEWLRKDLINTVSCCNSITLFYNGLHLPRARLLAHLQALEEQLGDLSKIKVPSRLFRLPISFESESQDQAIQRYIETQRPYAPYLPSNLDFVAQNNALTAEELKKIYLTGQMMVVEVGFFCGNTCSLPVDPRQRLNCPKQNPSRVFTPEGTVSWGGSCMSIYPVDSPGGYQMTGRTVPCWDMFGYKKGFSPERPWLFQDFDILTYYQVSEDELDVMLQDFKAGKYTFEFEDIEFDMAEHNELVENTKSDVDERRKKQAIAQEKMTQAEAASIAKWQAEKSQEQIDVNVVETLLQDENIEAIEAPVDANVWKVEVKDGDKIEAGKVVVILEAMKLEINVCAREELEKGARVEMVLVRPGDSIRAGEKVALIRKV